MGLDVVTVGDSVVDIIVPVSRFPEGNEDSVSGERMEKQLGGASNFLLMASRLGLNVGIIDCIGDDDLGAFYRNTLKSERVDVSRLIMKKGLPTSSCIVLVDKEGKHAYIGFAGATSHLTPEEINEAYIQSAKAFYSSGYALGGIPIRKANLYALSIAHKREIPIFFDPSPALSRIPREIMWEAISLSKFMLLNEREMEIITGSSIPEKGVTKILDAGPSTVILKRGAQGCLVCTHSRFEDVPAFSVKVIDTTGAGDSFNAAFVFGQLKGWTLKNTAVFANAVGAIKVTKLGAGKMVPTRDEVLNFITEHKIDAKGL